MQNRMLSFVMSVCVCGLTEFKYSDKMLGVLGAERKRCRESEKARVCPGQFRSGNCFPVPPDWKTSPIFER